MTTDGERFREALRAAEERVRATIPGSLEWREAQRAVITLRADFWEEMRRTWRPAYESRVKAASRRPAARNS